MKHGSLFSGYGGLDLAVNAVFGTETAWVSDVDPGACKVLARRFPGVPNLGDVTRINWSDVEPVDVLSAGSPCQDLSTAGRRAGMTEGTRSNLWVQVREAVNVLRPRFVVWENVRGAYSASAASDLEQQPGRVGDEHTGPVLRALGRVLGDMADRGYDAQWCGVRASDVGAPHQRFRVFLLAYPASVGRDERRTEPEWQQGRLGATRDPESVADTDHAGLERRPANPERAHKQPAGPGSVAVQWGDYEPAIRRWEAITSPAPDPVDERGRLNPEFASWMMGLPPGWITDVPGVTRTEALRMAGNGVVPQQAISALTHMINTMETT